MRAAGVAANKTAGGVLWDATQLAPYFNFQDEHGKSFQVLLFSCLDWQGSAEITRLPRSSVSACIVEIAANQRSPRNRLVLPRVCVVLRCLTSAVAWAPNVT